MKKFNVLLILLAFSFSTQAQLSLIEHIEYTGTANQVGNKIDVSSLGAVLKTGNIENTAGNKDIFITRDPKNGLAITQNTFGIATQDEGICTKAIGNRTVHAGHFNGTFDVNPSIFVVSNISSPNGIGVYIHAMDTFSIANHIWAKTIVPANGTSKISITDMTYDNNGNIFIVGNFSGSINVEGGTTMTSGTYGDMYFAKYSIAGTLQWIKQLSLNTSPGTKTGIPGFRSNSANTICVDANNDIYIAGKIVASTDLDPNAGVMSTFGTTSIFISKYTTNGDFIRYFKATNADTDIDEIFDMSIKNNSIVVTGVYGGLSNTADLDSSSAVFKLPNAGFEGSVFTAKYDTTFNFQWAVAMDNLVSTTNYLGKEVYGKAIAMDNAENVYVAVSYKRNIDFNPSSPSTTNVTTNNTYDAAIVKYSSAGVFDAAYPFGGTGNDEINDILVDASDNIHINGYFSNTIDIDPSGAVLNLTSTGGTDWMYAKFSQSTPLPVLWNSFNAELQSNNSVALSWSTSSEINASHFEVEKSQDAKSWTLLSKVNAVGNSNSENNYQIIDAESFVGTMYYRIKQVDIDGKFSYSLVDRITKSNLNEISIYPNPATDKLFISIPETFKNSILEVFSMQGLSVLKVNKLSKNYTLAVLSLTKGHYVIRVSNEEQTFTYKFLKE